ncbi:uncharacterized protein BJ212DRAFT_1294516 [Suillus subaureus]|uniref:Mid2 domain-containing protein n=1 Tax=Suillus subaureus TaxID=48587 RepID=A0A9P7JK72_9AGAM|nr:uncharacterized protein BJ212DRAFT_1294516 [Suillus subaureus]KAG1827173.1 hypothetical protein BJ212DRAFT_1294516 [Suillus subaureus]
MSPLSQAWSLIVVLAVALVPRGALAQTSNVTCLSSFGWMDNSLQQSPCVVASYLESVCWGGDFTVSSLPPGTHYAAPTVADANKCECSTVTYSLVSACGACQNATFLNTLDFTEPRSWSQWNYNCSLVYLQEYPNNIPSGTVVPNWAYLNVTTAGFDLTAAQSAGDLPESTATSVQSTGSVTYSSSVSASLTSSSGAATGSSTTSSKSNVGAIAGGVVGGFVGAAVIIGLATWYFVKRRRSATAPSAAFSDIGGGPGYTQSVYSANPHPFPMQPQMTQQPRLYDPSDPTTFPGSPPSPTVLTTASSNIYQNPSIPSHVFSQQSRPGQYSGTPEI